MEILLLVLTIALIDFLSILTPGQDFAIVTRNTLRHGRHTGAYTVFGIGFVTLLHCLLAMLGISLLLSQSPNLMAGIKTIGALYLIYLGTGFFKNAQNLEPQKANVKKTNQENISNTKAFKMGAIANLFNIEPIMAFVSIFAIILPAETLLSTKLIICALLPLNTILWLLLVCQVFSLKKVQMFLSLHLKKVEQAIGVILIFFGSKTLLEVRKH